MKTLVGILAVDSSMNLSTVLSLSEPQLPHLESKPNNYLMKIEYSYEANNYNNCGQNILNIYYFQALC